MAMEANFDGANTPASSSRNSPSNSRGGSTLFQGFSSIGSFFPKINRREFDMKNAWNQVFRHIQSVCVIGLLSIGISSQVIAAESDREQVYQQARVLLQQEQAGQAYALLSQHEAEWSGEDAYDYLLGVAALDSGEAGEAIFSLQRLVARRPAFSGARMELARAYYDIGDNELARIEFERILADEPPELVLEAATEYMSAIDAKAREYTASVQYFVDVGFGWDTNPPAATDEGLFLGLTLNANNLEQSSSFYSVAAGALYSRPLSPETQFMATARLDHRSNPSTHFVDSSNIDLGIGWSWTRGRHTVYLGANTMVSALAQEHNKNDLGISGNYTLKLNDSWSYMLFMRAGSMRFEETALEVRDVDQFNFGLSLTQNYSNAMFNVTLTGASDKAKQSNSPFSTDGYGLRLSNSWFRPGGRVYFVEASATTTEYDDPFFGIDRDDDVYTVGLGASFAKFPTKNWVSTVKLNLSEKDSTVSLYEFQRLEIAFSLRKVI